MIVIVDAAANVTLLTVMVWPDVLTVPVLDVVQPTALALVGALQPAGTATVTTPLFMPPAAAVKVNDTL